MKNHVKKFYLTFSAVVLSFCTFCSISESVSAEYSESIRVGEEFSFSVPEFRTVAGTDEIQVSEFHEYSFRTADTDENVFPESFDLRSMGLVSPVRNQSGYGTCWVHSAIACAEASVINSNPYVNLSEFHTAYYAFGEGQVKPFSDSLKDVLNNGGTAEMVLNLWSQWIGTADEKYCPYGDTERLTESTVPYVSDYHLKNSCTFDFNRDRTNDEEVKSLVKEYVYSGKPVDVSFYSNSSLCYDYINSSTNSKRKPRWANHSVAIVGWDDNYSAENFKIKPENNGAWLVKNSWGDSYGQDGFIWISYEDRSLCEFFTFELDDKNNYKYNYQHDSFVPVQFLSAEDSSLNVPSYMGNIFLADDDMQIEAITSYSCAGGTEYEITVYTGLENLSDVSSGVPSETTCGTMQASGFFTLELDKPVTVKKGEYFGVSVKLYNSESPFVVPVETNLFIKDRSTGDISSIGSYTTYEGIKSHTEKGESFTSSDGSTWEDVSGSEFFYSDEEKEYLLQNLKEQLMDGLEDTDTKEIQSAEQKILEYTELFSNGDVGIITGNISMKVLANPVGTVHFSEMSGQVAQDKKIELSVKTGEDIYYSVNDGEFQKYTSPLAVEDDMTIKAKSGGTVSERHYTPEKASLNQLEYYEVKEDGSNTKKKYVSLSDGYTQNIKVEPDTQYIRIAPFSYAEMYLGEKKIISGDFRTSLYPENLYEISLFQDSKPDSNVKIFVSAYDMGDVNLDGKIDASDASSILVYYASVSTGNDGTLENTLYADFNADGNIDATDASGVLMRYAELSTM